VVKYAQESPVHDPSLHHNQRETAYFQL